jgi:hypothetical protein
MYVYINTYIYIHTHTYIYIYIYIGVARLLIPWQPLCEAMSELNKAVQTCIQQLRYMTTGYTTSSSPNADAIIRQCEELFEFSRNVSVSGVRGLFVEGMHTSIQIQYLYMYSDQY